MDFTAAEKYLGAASKKFSNVSVTRGNTDLAHDKTKDRILKEGIVCPPLVALGIMDESGKVFKTKMDKFVQINNFLRILGDVVKKLETPDRPVEIVDFCCGKSYLTFVIQYYFSEILKRPARITGIDSKSDVIKNCNDIKCGANINLIADDINNFRPKHEIDIALSLHACDTATDIVLKKAASLGARVILSVPCCHKQLAKQIKNPDLDFILKYGLLKERFAEILTDALRANWLAGQGYKVDVMEFVDYSNSPKNVMLRAVKTGRAAATDLQKIANEFNVIPDILK
jgi:trans-aconitate methyltransferase